MGSGWYHKLSRELAYPFAALLAFLAGPVFLVAVPYYYLAVVGNQSGQNFEMFLALVGALVGVLFLGLGGIRFHALRRKRIRFDALLSGERRSELRRNWDEIERVARGLPGRYQVRLRAARQELKQRR